MKKTFTLWAAACLFLSGTVFGQNPAKRTCGTLAAIDAIEKADPGFKARRLQNETAIANYIKNMAVMKVQGGPASKIIPVVFHVVYNTAAQNVPDARIHQQIQKLNDDFRRRNSDTITDPVIFRNLGGDTGIEFGLATIDPSGNPTTGITRTTTTVGAFTVFSPNAVKGTTTGGKAPWPNTDYLNIWVCNISGGILGYATPPGTSPTADGVVLLYSSLPGGPSPYGLGRTATHEVGHFLNLDHIWADEPGCAADDFVADTPQQREENYGCPTFPLTTGDGRACTAGAPGAMFMNYMDYVDDACMHMFTKGQRSRMLAALNTQRPTLLTSAATRTFVANFAASSTNIPAGTPISFTNTSTGAPTGFSWSFPGAVSSTSAVQNPAGIIYNTPGTYAVTLTISKGTLSNTRTITNYINVTNPTTCADTLNAPLTGTPAIYTTTNPGGVKNGYVAGNNGFGDKAKAEFFTNTNNLQIKGGQVKFSKAKFALASSTITIAVWNSAGTGGKPGAIIASKTVPKATVIADIAANRLTTVAFTTPATVSGNFYMGIVLNAAAGDTVVLVTNSNNNAPAGKGWAQASNNTWDTYSARWNLNISNAVFPIVNATPPVVNFTPASATICRNNTVAFTSTTTGAISYQWTFPGGTPGSSTLPNPVITYNTPGTYSVTLKATAQACGLITTTTKTNIINVGAPLAVTVNPPSVSKCTLGPTTLTANTGNNTTTYKWSPAAGLNTTTGKTVIASPTVTTAYKVVATTNGCKDSTYVSYIVTNPVANFTATPNPVDIKTSGTVTFTNTSTNSLFYSWNFGDPGSGTNNTSSLQHPTHTYTQPGSYTVSLTSNRSGCNSTPKTMVINVTNTTGLEQAFENGTIKIYPNPASRYLRVEVPEKEEVTQISLLNAIGQKVAVQKPVAGAAKLNVSALPAGIYFVRISNAEGSITRKVTVMP